MDAGVLADVEGVQVESEGADEQDERVDESLGEAEAVVFGEAAAQDFEVVLELGG